MNWLARLKKTQIPPNMDATNATKPGFVGFVASIPAPIQKTECVSAAANDPVQTVGLMVNPVLATLVTPEPAAMPDPDRWCWPHSSAMTGREIDTMIERTGLFNRRGLSALEAELLADKLVNRDREADDRRLCLECAHLSRAGGLRCAQWQRAGLGAPGVPAGLHLVLQRCNGFKAAT